MLCKQEKLINSYTEHFHTNLKYGPLQAKILAYILIKGKKNEGITFEEILEYTQASKSSVSTSINNLLDRKSVVYFYKPNDRKKHFTTNNLSSVLERTQKIIEQELLLLDQMIKYREDQSVSDIDNMEITNIKLFKEYLKQTHTNLDNTLQKFKS